MLELPPWREPRAAYLHIPFCRHHCGYCDFAVTAGQDQLIEHYLDALSQELSTLGEPRPVETIFIGGGTPTYLDDSQLQRLLAAISHWLPLLPGGEWSIESTPDSLTPQKTEILRSRGVSRVSIGIQSFDPELLSALDRRHTSEQIPLAVEAVRGQGLELSFDLIFAAPGATLERWNADLSAALIYEPQHISTYGLTYEKGTPLWKQRERGLLQAVAEERELEMYELAIEWLTRAGFEHYEVSNFARPGHRCRHNEHYWANDAYYGFGVGAARYVDGVRQLNTRDTKSYIRKVLSGESPTFQSERLNDRDRAFETIGTQLRRSCGINHQRFQEQTGYSLRSLVAGRLEVMIAGGLLVDNGTDVKLTHRGLCVADGVIEELMKANGASGG